MVVFTLVGNSNNLENSEELKQLLKDSRLQKAILAIDSAATDKLSQLENFMNSDADFTDFVQNLLRVVNPTSTMNDDPSILNE